MVKIILVKFLDRGELTVDHIVFLAMLINKKMRRIDPKGMNSARLYKNIIVYVIFIFLAYNLVAQNAVMPPKDVRLGKVSFTKISIVWEPSAANQAPVKYLILRDGKKLKVIESTSFTDTRLTPDKTYRYSVVAINSKGEKSAQTPELAIKTLEPLSIDSNNTIQKAVDYFHSKDVKTADFEKFIDDKVATLKNSKLVDVDLIKDMVSEEIKWIRAPAKKLTAEEQVKEKQALDKFLKDNYAGEPFFKVYLQAKLIELADKHLLKKNYKGAEALYKAALSVSSKVEMVVSIILNSLAKTSTAQIDEKTPAKEAIKHLQQAERYYLKFSKYFPKSKSHYKALSYTLATFAWTHFFPQLLTPQNYNRIAYKSALRLARLALEADPKDPMKEARISRIEKWDLISLKIFCYGNARRPARGRITIKNVDKKLVDNLPSDHVLLKENKYSLKGYPIDVPIYTGRKYNIIVEVKLGRGPLVKHSFNGISFEKGSDGIYYSDKEPSLKVNKFRGNKARITFIVPKPLTPYNLRIEDNFDSSSLCWDWIPPNSYFKLKYFKVYGDGEEIAQTKDCELKGISKKFECVYKIKAVGINGKSTKFSLPFKVALKKKSKKIEQAPILAKIK